MALSLQNQDGEARRLNIVTSSWLAHCQQQNSKVDEGGHALPLLAEKSNCPNGSFPRVNPLNREADTLKGRLNEILSMLHESSINSGRFSPKSAVVPPAGATQHMLLSSCQFFLLGFDSPPTTKGEDLNCFFSEIHFAIARLIRRGLGTIYWELNRSVTHIVMNDDLDEHEYR
jgi:hypothetical protein